MNIHFWRRAVCVYCLVQYTERRLQHTIFIMTHFLTNKSQTEVYSAVLLATWGEDKYLCSCGLNSDDQVLFTHWKRKTELCHGHTQHCSYSTHSSFNCLVNPLWAVPTGSLCEGGLCSRSYSSGILHSHNWHQRAHLNPHITKHHNYIFQ